MSLDTASQLRGLHAVIESRLNGPSVLLVTAATSVDDSAAIARGITDSFRTGGTTVAFVRVLADGSEDDLALRGEIRAPEISSTRAQLDEIVSAWRESYDLVVVEASPVMKNSLAPRIAVLADGVILAVARGRSICADDRATSQLLDNLGAKLLGVVTTNKRKRPGSARSASSAAMRARDSEAAPLFLRS